MDDLDRTINQLMDEQGWDTNSLIDLLVRFLQTVEGLPQLAIAFLVTEAEAEREPAEIDADVTASWEEDRAARAARAPPGGGSPLRGGVHSEETDRQERSTPVTQTAPHPAGQTTDPTAEDPTVEDLLLAAAERMELTERGWIEKVTMAGHGNLVTHLTSRLLALGVDPETLYWGVRLTKERSGAWYVPDGIVVRAANPVPADPERIYAGVPDLAIEILSGDPQTAAGRAEQERDLREKRGAYAARGIPHYWIVDPLTRRVAWLALDPRTSAYEDRWEGPLAEAAAPWAASPV